MTSALLGTLTLKEKEWCTMLEHLVTSQAVFALALDDV